MLGNKKIFAILAVDLNNGIGYQNKILFRNKIDMQLFKDTTESIKYCIVGRTTYEGLPKHIQNTRNLVVLTSQEIDGISTIKDITDIESIDTDTVIVIGGAKVYEAFAPFVDLWIVTTFKKEAELVNTYLSQFVVDTYTSKVKGLRYEDEDIVINQFC